MLQKLSIKNIALISDLSIDFDNGLSVLSGETGAGKSLIIDSISLLLGLRADKSLISSGQREATVTAVFDLSKNMVAIDYLESVGLEREETAIVYRKIDINGKNECKVNGMPFSLSMLRGFSSKIMDLHGQFEHQSLLKVSSHILLLDGFEPKSLFNDKQQLQKLCAERSTLLSELSEFSGSDAERAREIDLLSYQINEIDNSGIKENEFEELKELRYKIINQEKIAEGLESALQSLDDGGTLSIGSSIVSALSSLSSISSYDENIARQHDRLQSLKYDFDDIFDELKSIKENSLFNETEADKIEDRLEFIKSLFKKYGGDYNSVMKYFEESSKRLEKLTTSGEQIEKLKSELEVLEAKIFVLEEKLSISRRNIAVKFEKNVMKELSDLGMGSSHFVVNIDSNKDKISPNGYDSVEFLLSTNIGEPVKPLIKIVSGGEMSRFMLAIKNVTCKLENIDTMIFDEIDSGISGKMGRVVAEKMAKISREYQVLCVSHLPQIAAMADHNYLITKSTSNNKTRTNLELLDEKSKIEEVSRLAGGVENSSLSLSHASELIESSNIYKKSI